MDYFKTFTKYWKALVLVVLAATVFSFTVSLLQTPKYLSTAKLLVIQRQGNRLDAYSAARSAETVASVLSRMIYTSSFFDRVQKSEFDLNAEFANNPELQREQWRNMVNVDASGNGSIVVDVYHEDRATAENYALAIASVLVNNGREYHGGDAQIEIKMVDYPFTSVNPATPNVVQNTFIGFMVGVLISSTVVVLLTFKKQQEVFGETVATAGDGSGLTATSSVAVESTVQSDDTRTLPSVEPFYAEDPTHTQGYWPATPSVNPQRG